MVWAPDYVEVDDLADYERITDSSDDAQLALAISAASRAIDRDCRRQFGLVVAPEARWYRTRVAACGLVVDIDDLMTTTGLMVAGVAVVDPVLRPRNAGAEGEPWTVLEVDSSAYGEVEVTARWGWTEVPAAIKQACLLQASRFFARRSSPYGIAGSPETGSELRLLARVDPDVAVSLRPYRKAANPR